MAKEVHYYSSSDNECENFLSESDQSLIKKLMKDLKTSLFAYKQIETENLNLKDQIQNLTKENQTRIGTESEATFEGECMAETSTSISSDKYEKLEK